MQLIYDVRLTSAMQQSDPALHTYVYIYIRILLKYSFLVSFITGYRMWFPVLYSRGLSIHSL